MCVVQVSLPDAPAPGADAPAVFGALNPEVRVADIKVADYPVSRGGAGEAGDFHYYHGSGRENVLPLNVRY